MGTVREEFRSAQTSGLDDVINWGRINAGVRLAVEGGVGRFPAQLW